MAYLLIFLFAFVFTVTAVPVSIILAKKYDALDYPKARKVHRKPVPRWGGIGIFVGLILALLSAYFFIPQFKELIVPVSAHKDVFKVCIGIVLGSFIIFLLGFLDDVIRFPAKFKLLVQLLVASIMFFFGVKITGIGIPFTSIYLTLPLVLSFALSLFWFCGFINAINLADGLDGLATGIVAIASAAFFVVAILLNNGVLTNSAQMGLSAFLAVAVCGAALGFLIYNFNPAKVFMGDGGSLFLGFMLATITMTGTLKSTAVLALFVPIIVVALPILDVALALFRRLRKGMGIMMPDKEHIHHRLLQYGWSQREIVLLMYVFTLILSIVSILLVVLKMAS